MMARYRIQDDESAVSVEVTEVGANAQKLLRALRECQAGQCSCPTDEYQKLASMDIQLAGDVISLRLEAKPRGDIRHLGDRSLPRLHDQAAGRLDLNLRTTCR